LLGLAAKVVSPGPVEEINREIDRSDRRFRHG